MVFILHEWIDHEGLAFYGVFSTLKKACEAGVIVARSGADPLVAQVEQDDMAYLDKGGEYAFDKRYTLDGAEVVKAKSGF